MLEQKPRDKAPGPTITKSNRLPLDPWKLRQPGGLGRFLRWRFILPAAALVLVVLGVYGFFTFNTVRNHVTSGAAHIQAAVDQVKNDSASFNLAALDRLKQELRAGEQDFRQAREATGPLSLVLPLFG